MTSLPFPVSTWSHDTLAAVDLKDRRTQRLLDTAEQIAQKPEGSLPSKFSLEPPAPCIASATGPRSLTPL